METQEKVSTISAKVSTQVENDDGDYNYDQMEDHEVSNSNKRKRKSSSLKGITDVAVRVEKLRKLVQQLLKNPSRKKMNKE